MNPGEFLLKISGLLDTSSISEVISSFHQDKLIWESISEESFLNTFSEAAGKIPDAWNPGAFALHSIASDELAATISQEPLQALASELRQHASAIFQKTLKSGESPASLPEAVYLALALRERKRLTSSWSGMVHEITRTASSHTFDCDIWQTSFSILFSWFEQEEQLLEEITSTQEYLTEQLYYNFLSGIILSQANSADCKKAVLATQIEQEDFGHQVNWLQQLSLLHPVIARNIASQLISTYQPEGSSDFCTNSIVYNEFLVDLASQSKNVDPLSDDVYDPDFSTIDHWLNLFEIAGDDKQYDALLDYKNELLDNLQSRIRAYKIRKTQSPIANSDQPNPWVDLAKKSPHSGVALAELILSDASHVLEIEIDNERLKQSDDALVCFARAKLSLLKNDQETARNHIIQAIQRTVNKQPSQADAARHVLIIKNLGFPDLARDYLYQLANQIVFSPSIHKWLAAEQITLGNYEQAVNSARTSLILDDSDISTRRVLGDALAKNNQTVQALEEWEHIINISQEDDTNRLNDLISYAKAALNLGQPDLAISTCEKMLISETTNGTLLSLMGDAHQAKGDADSASEYYTRAVSFSPEVEHPWMSLASYHLKRGDSDKGYEVLLTAMNACPNSAGLAAMLGDFYAGQGSYSDALPYMKKAMELEPGNGTYALKYGSNLQLVGQPAYAIDIFRLALIKDPHNLDLLQAYTTSLLSTGRIEEAYEPLCNLVMLQPATITPYIDLASTALTLSKVDKAIDLSQVEGLLKIGLKLDPTNYKGRLLEADLLAAIGRNEEARAEYILLAEEALLPGELRWRVNYGMGLMSSKMGQVDVALAALEEAGSLNPVNYEIQQRLAETYLSSGLQKASMEAAQAALSIAPDDPDNLIWYSEFCLKLGDIPESLSSLAAAIQHQPDNVELRMNLGKLQIKLNDVDAAKRTFEELIAHGHIAPALLRRIAKDLAEVGATEEAIHYLEFGIQQNPVQSLPLLMDLAEYQKANGNLAKSVDVIDQAIALDPDNLDLVINKADLLAYAGDYTAAITTLEEVAGRSKQGEDTTLSSGLFNIYLRLVFLHRKIGDLNQALTNVKKALEIHPTSQEAIYLSADISYNLLDFPQTITHLKTLTQLLSENLLPVSIPAEFLSNLVISENGEKELTNDCAQLALSPRWFLWQTALSILSKTTHSYSEEENHVLLELVGHSAEDIYQDLPLDDYQASYLPKIKAYNLILSAPTMLYPVLDAALSVNQFKSALSILDTLVEDYPLEPAIDFYLIKTLTLQAEAYRHYSELQLVRHSPTSDAISVAVMDQFNDALLNIKRITENSLVRYWELRGRAAFIPNLENFEALIQFNSPHSKYTHILHKLAIQNDVAGIEAAAIVKNESIPFAATLIASKAPAKAFALLSRAVELDQRDPVILAEIALAAEKAAEYPMALEAIENALGIWPDEPRWHNMAAILCKQVGDSSSALKHLKTAADLEPENFDILLSLGESSIDFGDIPQAIQYLKIASSLNGADYKPWFLLAKAHHLRGDQLQAIANIDRAVTLAPNIIEPVVLSAELSLANGQVDQAIQKADSAIRMNPREVNAILIKVKALRLVDQPEEAMKLIDYAITKVTKPLPLLIEKAEMIKDMQGNKAYLASLQKLADDYPKNSEILRLYALALAENGYPSESLNITQLSLKHNPDQSDMHILAGRLLRSTGQLDQALDHITQAISLDHSNVEGYIELARTYQERRDYAKAISIYEQAISEMPGDYRPYYHLGLALKDSKNYRGAESMLRKAADLSKDDVNVLRQLGAIIAINLVHPA